MIPPSRLFDLRLPGVTWDDESDSLPAKMVTPSGELLRSVYLPYISLCADYLIGPDNVWAGVSVTIRKEDIATISAMFRLASPKLVQLLLPEQIVSIERYKGNTNFAYLEIAWSQYDKYDISFAVSECVIWYSLPDAADSVSEVVVMGLSDMEYMIKDLPEETTLPSILK